MLLVNGFEAWVETPAGRFALSAQQYPPDIVHPDGRQRIEAFTTEPWPQWTFVLEDSTRLTQELFVRHGAPLVVLSWRLYGAAPSARLLVRPLLSGRHYHALHHENPGFRFDPEMHQDVVVWRPYPGVPGVVARSNASYTHQPEWYRNFLYEEERRRGLDYTEDLAAPGVFQWDLTQAEAVLLLTTEAGQNMVFPSDDAATVWARRLRVAERKRRQRFASSLDRAADSYLVRRGAGKTIVAGYPWFTDWGCDTFIALRGLCLATGRLAETRAILLEWAGTVTEGMLPNRFPDGAEAPEFNAVDASLWYIVAVYEFMQAMTVQKRHVTSREQQRLQHAIEAILSGYARGTRYGIHLDDDGLLAAGVPGVQLTWMDAKVGEWVVTPRLGKPVEVEALWLNALWIGSRFSAQWKDLFTRGCETFRARFWNEAGGSLYDVIDVNHQPGTVDASCRPNQIFAVGGLPLVLLDAESAHRVVEAVESRLWTPLGLRSLAPGEPGYTPRYAGGVRDRDGAYHQGTVWPWLIGPFVEAWVRVRGNTCEARQMGRSRYLQALLQHLNDAGLGHISSLRPLLDCGDTFGCPACPVSCDDSDRHWRAVPRANSSMRDTDTPWNMRGSSALSVACAGDWSPDGVRQHAY